MTSEVKNRGNKKQPAAQDFKKSEFINHTFSDSDKRAFKEWSVAAAKNIADALDKLVDDGYSLSLKFDTYNDCYGAFIQTRDEKSGNYGYILSGRGRSGTSAVLGVLYRHYVLFEGEWPTDTVRHAGTDDD